MMTNNYDLGRPRWPVAVMFGVGVWIGVGLLSAIALAMWITS